MDEVRGPAQPAPRVVQADPVVRITAARSSHSEDVSRRMRNYAFSMAIRTACVVVFVVLFPHWTAWLAVPGAVFLPYVAVLLANAGRERTPARPAGLGPVADPRRQLASGRHDDAA